MVRIKIGFSVTNIGMPSIGGEWDIRYFWKSAPGYIKVWGIKILVLFRLCDSEGSVRQLYITDTICRKGWHLQTF